MAMGMSDTVYEILQDGKPSYQPLYRYKPKAQNYIDRMNKTAITRIMLDANRMTGAIYGRNKRRFAEMINEVVNPPWTIKERRIN